MALLGKDKLMTALGSAVATYVASAFVAWDLQPWSIDAFIRTMMLVVFVFLYGVSITCDGRD